MAFFTLGEALVAADLGRSRSAHGPKSEQSNGQPGGRVRHDPRRPRIRGGSRLKGACEAGFWSGFDRQAGGRLMLAAERYDRGGRPKGRRNGPLGHVGLELLRALIRRVDHRTGRLDPALTTLMADVKRSRGAVVAALKALREHGFLDWIRRYEPIAGDGPGPRIRQASNAYRLILPTVARTLLGKLWRPCPTPVEPIARNIPPDATTAPTPLANALARLEQALARRESTTTTETRQSPS